MERHCYICKNTRNCLVFTRLKKQIHEAQEGVAVRFKLPVICAFEVVENDGLFCDECWEKNLENLGDLGVQEMCGNCREKILKLCVEESNKKDDN